MVKALMLGQVGYSVKIRLGYAGFMKQARIAYFLNSPVITLSIEIS
jgi:hypothetical protein